MTDNVEDTSKLKGHKRLRNVYFEEGSFVPTITDVKNKKHKMGVYQSPILAAIVQDMGILSQSESPDNQKLNFSYEVKSDNYDGKVLTSVAGFDFFVSASVEDYDSITTNNLQRKVHQNASGFPAQIVASESCLHVDIRKPWNERSQSTYLPTASFVYEITFPNQNPLGLNLKPYYIMNTISAYNNGVGCLLVRESTPFLSNFIQPGDILLRVNDTELISTSSTFSFKDTTVLVTKATSPRTIRFMRPGTLRPSPIEVKLLAEDTTQVVAKANVMVIDPIAISQGQTHNSQNSKLQILHIDAQAPLATRRGMQGMLTSTAPSPAAMYTPSTSGYKGIVKDRANKWLVTVTSEGSSRLKKTDSPHRLIPKVYFVGKFDTEDEAIAMWKKAHEGLNTKGTLPSKTAQLAALSKFRQQIKSNSSGNLMGIGGVVGSGGPSLSSLMGAPHGGGMGPGIGIGFASSNAQSVINGGVNIGFNMNN